MAWLTLIPLAAVCIGGAWLTYAERFKVTGWYPWAFALMGGLTALLYGLAVQRCDKPESFRYSVAYDMVVLVAYYVFPLAVGLVRPHWTQILAAVLVCAAACLVKWGGE